MPSFVDLSLAASARHDLMRSLCGDTGASSEKALLFSFLRALPALPDWATSYGTLQQHRMHARSGLDLRHVPVSMKLLHRVFAALASMHPGYQ